jgi:hypothetical protein
MSACLSMGDGMTPPISPFPCMHICPPWIYVLWSCALFVLHGPHLHIQLTSHIHRWIYLHPRNIWCE